MKKKWIVVLCSFILLFLPTVCMAGTINGNEQSVYSAACGTFTHEGKSYQAAPEYLAQLRSYLSRDDVDLTAEQASAAISQMYSSVAEGVANGYILPVGSDGNSGDGQGTSDDTTGDENDGTGSDGQLGDTEPEDDEGVEAEAGPDDETGVQAPGDSGNGSDVTGDDGTGTGSETGVSGEGGMAADDENDASENEEDSTTDAQADFWQYVEKYNAGIGKENAEILKKRPADETKAAQAIHYDATADTEMDAIQDVLVGKQLQFIKFAGMLSVVLFLFAGIRLLVKKCFRFQKNDSSTDHHTRRKIRKTARPLMAAAFGIGLSAVAVAAVMQAGLFKNDVVASSLNDSGYYKESYEKLLEEVHQMVTDAGCMENTLDGVLSYEKFRFDCKNFLQAELSGNAKTATFDTTKEEIINAVDGVAYFTDESKQELAETVIDCYKSRAVNGVGDIVYRTKSAFWQESRPFLIAAIAAAVLSLLCPILAERNKYHIADTAGIGFIITGILSFLAYIVLVVQDAYANVYVEPDYLYLFFYRYLTDGGQLYLIPALGAAAVGVICLLAGKKMRSLS